MKIHLVDATYELFRNYFGAPAARSPDGEREVGATRGFLRTLVSLLRQEDTTHVACAFDHVIESFRNRLFDGYKRGEGIPEELLSQFELAERAAAALGLVVWPMEEFEADDALATGAARWLNLDEVERIYLCSPDKDLAQCVIEQHVVMLDRRNRREIDEAAVIEKFGVAPAAIPDWLALVGDSADGIPGIPRWGAKSASTLLARYHRLDAIPEDAADWKVKVRGASALASSLREHRQEALLYRRLTTLRTDVPLQEELEDLRWLGAPRAELEALCAEIGENEVLDRLAKAGGKGPAGWAWRRER